MTDNPTEMSDMVQHVSPIVGKVPVGWVQVETEHYGRTLSVI